MQKVGFCARVREAVGVPHPLRRAHHGASSARASPAPTSHRDRPGPRPAARVKPVPVSSAGRDGEPDHMGLPGHAPQLAGHGMTWTTKGEAGLVVYALPPRSAPATDRDRGRQLVEPVQPILLSNAKRSPSPSRRTNTADG